MEEEETTVEAPLSARPLAAQKIRLGTGDWSAPHLEDHPRTCKWLITMVIVSPVRIGLWDPFQMAELDGL